MDKKEIPVKTDFVGHDLAIGDDVAFILPKYRELTLGRVVKINNIMIKVQYLDYSGREKSHQTHPKNIVKVDPTDAFILRLKR